MNPVQGRNTLAAELVDIIENAVDSTTRLSDDIMALAEEHGFDLSKIHADEVVDKMVPFITGFVRDAIKAAIEFKELVDSE
jgi:hypothetical protein